VNSDKPAMAVDCLTGCKLVNYAVPGKY